MNLLANPWLIIGALVGSLVLFGGGFYAAWSWQGSRCEARIAAMQADSRARKDSEAQKASDASTELEKGDAKDKVVYKTITKYVDRVVERPVYKRACFDADGLRLANAALTGTSPDPGEPDSPMSRPDAAP